MTLISNTITAETSVSNIRHIWEMYEEIQVAMLRNVGNVAGGILINFESEVQELSKCGDVEIVQLCRCFEQEIIPSLRMEFCLM